MEAGGAQKGRLRRALWLVLAYAALGLALAGVFLPLLPTTPFVLLAAFAASRGSQRLHDWLLEHSVFGPIIADWERGRTVRRRAKVAAVATMIASLGLMVIVDVPLVAVAIAALAMATVGLWLWTRPEPGSMDVDRLI